MKKYLLLLCSCLVATSTSSFADITCLSATQASAVFNAQMQNGYIPSFGTLMGGIDYTGRISKPQQKFKSPLLLQNSSEVTSSNGNATTGYTDTPMVNAPTCTYIDKNQQVYAILTPSIPGPNWYLGFGWSSPNNQGNFTCTTGMNCPVCFQEGSC